IELHAADAVLDRVRVVAPVHVRHGEPVVEEAEVKFARFEHAPDVPVIIRRPRVRARERTAPGAGEIGAVLRLQEGDQGHLAHEMSSSARRRIDVLLSSANHLSRGPPMQKFDEAAYRDLAEALRERVAVYTPDWTGGNDSDPGVSLIELFAFLAESLLYRANLIPERGRASAIRLAQSALMLAGPATAVTPGTLERLRYFAGQLLSPDDLTLEQDYFRARLRRLNRELYGSGIVGGLGVSVGRAGAAQQVI